MSQESKNVNGGKLSFFQDGIGFFKDGYCRTGQDDKRHLSVAAIMTHAFHQSEYGDDDYKGISAGQRTCMSAHDFKEAIKEMGPDLGPKVYLEATDRKALDVVSMSDLKRYAVDQRRSGAGER
ncbi:hypothetical protein LTR97_006204 [Elasticomyces elasticus]|uniref:Uncharacterized protein n=1 Tax=Elasticomyces elasticus TaxID=574655 RepID=A0AAN7WJB2_9PEZI|nr:hypothetical protein LTR97_006204 [Elasticomyces elasticus]